MKILKLVFVFLITLCYLPVLLPAQTITQDEFLNLLIKTHPLFEKEKLTTQIEKEEQNNYLGAEDWTFFSAANFSHLEPAIAYAGPEKMDTFSLDGGLERFFWKTVLVPCLYMIGQDMHRILKRRKHPEKIA